MKKPRVALGVVAFFLLLVMQVALRKASHFVAHLVPHQQIDPFNSFAEISIHHACLLLISLLIVWLLNRLLNLDFHFQLGDRRQGIRVLALFTATFVVISIVQHTLMAISNQLPVYAFPLDARNILGTLGFQLLLTGPAEEVFFRALPIVLLTYSFGTSVRIKGDLTLEVVLSSVLFAFAHTGLFGMVYAFALGLIQGVVYQKTRSILYPILMHSFSNVLMVGGGYLFTLLFA